MSIIQEALKKAQVTIGIGAPKAAAPGQAKAFEAGQTPGRTPAPVKAKPFPKSIILVSTALLIAAIALISLSLGPLVATRLGRDGTQASTPPAQEVRYRALPPSETGRSAVDETQAASRQDAELASTAPNLVLNGIMYLEEGPRAIVNNVMVEVGEYASGARVVRISKKSVVLVYNDVEITLNLK